MWKLIVNAVTECKIRVLYLIHDVAFKMRITIKNNMIKNNVFENASVLTFSIPIDVNFVFAKHSTVNTFI